MTRILVVEDNPELLESLQSNLEMEEYEVFVATRAAQAVPLAVGQSPDLIVLDLGLPDRDGYRVLEDLRGRGIMAPVVILSARNQESDKLEGFRLGADDYVTKPYSPMELLARISALLRRSRWSDARAAESSRAASAPLTDQELKARFGLTERQIVVTRLVGDGYSNAEIARQLSLTNYTARNHVEQVLQKLGVSTRAAVGAILYGKR